MRRSLVTHGVCLFVGSIVTLAIVLWVQRGMGHAVAEGDGRGAVAPISGDVNGDGNLDVSDGIYIINYVFRGGPLPVPVACPPTGLPATGQNLCYDNLGNVIDCASAEFPGQDGSYQAGCPMAGRYVDHGDGTVTDTCTGLMWQKDTADISGNGSIGDWPEDAVVWQDALKFCEGLSFAGHEDWRLPNVLELQSIVDYGRWDQSIDPVFSAVSGLYWSSSSFAYVPGYAWIVTFGGGSVISGDDKGSVRCQVRAVRGGP